MPDDAPHAKPVAAVGPAPPHPARHRHVAAWLVGAVLVLALAGLATWRLLPPRVAVVHAHRGTAIDAVYATGTVEPTVMLPIAARITARLVELDVDEGDRVHAGQQLGRLEDTDLASNLAQLRSQEAFAQAEYRRYAALLPRGVIARTQYDKARSDWLSARSAVARAGAELRYARLLAPTDGTVIRRDGEIGQLMTPGTTLFWLAVDSPPRITADVDEEDIARIAPGQPVLIRADAFPGRVFQGRVRSVTPKGDPTGRSYRVRIAIDGDTPLRVGMTAEVNVIVRRHDHALLLPDGALAGDRVWIVRAGRLQSRRVAVGIHGERQVEITAGLSGDDAVVASPADGLRENAKVRVAGAGARP
ncbi:MAG TPA: efflux RND transporter periplasmic adaptor subunit [Frateuria sp.]|uniref:efflux RND transporter periplasmic adaptor subunit n=1 Tax=Frateuria sp. TaxID=2211372 RepID=UPI002D80198C|nr:efflux RND transporter periplasmic adaptor subunit [Frateuria sp.]HET6805503.1 efflux RND transporter periplasmic adaptor subunit [Frateuria sp.]